MTSRTRLWLTGLAAALALAGLSASYAKLELADPDAFADRSVEALQSDAVRVVIAEQIAVDVLERRSPDLLATRPLVLAAVEAVLGTKEFSRVLRRAAFIAHGLILRGDRDVRVELDEIQDILVPALQTASPELAAEIPDDIDPQIAEIRSGDGATWAIRIVDSASVVALPLLFAAFGLMAGLVAASPNRRRALGVAGIALAVGMAVGLVAWSLLRAQMLAHVEAVGVLQQDESRAAAAAAWDALGGDLRRWFLIVGIAGIAVWGSAALLETKLDRRASLLRVVELAAGGDLPRPLRVLRGLLLMAIGAMVLLQVDPVFEIAFLLGGGVLVILGLSEALSTARPSPRPAATTPAPRRGGIVLAGCALVLGAGVAVALVLSDDAPAPLEPDEITACNGLARNCDRRLDQVVLAGTHNSMSAADRPGWFFANQLSPVPKQLEDGIRLLMIDPHYGIVDHEGRVRTDLAAEGTTRNRVAAQLGADAIRAAERLAGRLDIVPAEGERKIYLCHTLCELGAERMSSTLAEIRGWLEANRSDVLVILVESSVDPTEVEEEFEEADLGPYLATLPRGEPLPTLREMIASGRRLVVLDERDGGDAPWYQPGFLFAQDTSIETFTSFRSGCKPRRGTPESPLLILNNWVDEFPPPPSEAAEANSEDNLRARVKACRKRLGRGPTAIAVDFYGRGDVISVVDDLNRRGDGSAITP